MPSRITDAAALNVTVSCFTSLLRRNFSAFKRMNQYATQSLRGLTSPASERLTLEACLCVCKVCLSEPTNVFFFERFFCQNNVRCGNVFIYTPDAVTLRIKPLNDAFVQSGSHVLLWEECSHVCEQQTA